MLGNPRVAMRLPAEDLDRTRALYYEKLGLNLVEQREGVTASRLRKRRVRNFAD
jgi:hypothetical protein